MLKIFPQLYVHYVTEGVGDPRMNTQTPRGQTKLNRSLSILRQHVLGSIFLKHTKIKLHMLQKTNLLLA